MKILLLSEAPMCVDAGGISQTLYNILSFCKQEELLCIAPEKEFERYPPSQPFVDRYITYKFEILKTPQNRIGRFLQSFISNINYGYNYFRRFAELKKSIKSFAPDIIISCPNGITGVFMHHKLLKKYRGTIIPYFMDDWMYKITVNVWLGNVQDLVRNILKENDAWMMIGNELAELLQERYRLKPKNILAIRNPVNVNDAPIPGRLTKKNQHTLAYAGALWGMHIDAFKIIAEAVKILSNEIKVSLIVYTSSSNWEWRKAELENLNVTYGGSIPYNQIHQKLSEVDGLIVVSSFSEEYYTHTKGSIQTKITDYLKSQRLIISCGPDYSANHNFLKKYDCGLCIETKNVNEVAGYLKRIFNNIEEYQPLIDKGFNVLQSEFSFETVQAKLKNFLKENQSRISNSQL